MKCILLVPGVPCVLFCPAACTSRVLSLSESVQKQGFAHLVAASLIHFPHGAGGGGDMSVAAAPARLNSLSKPEFEGKQSSVRKTV